MQWFTPTAHQHRSRPSTTINGLLSSSGKALSQSSCADYKKSFTPCTCEWVGSISQFIVILAFASSSCGRSAHLKCLFQADDYQTAQLYKWSSPVEKLERTLGTTVWSPLQRERVERLLL